MDHIFGIVQHDRFEAPPFLSFRYYVANAPTANCRFGVGPCTLTT
jgi:hypothetical protein